MTVEKQEPICSFCGKSKKEAGVFIQGMNNTMICGNCVNAAIDIIKNSVEVNSKDKFNLTPKEIFNKLNQYVVGQERAKKVLSTEVREHYKRISAPVSNYVDLEKSNILMIGPTGCGKTLLLKTIATILDVPFAIGDATTFTQAGYVGNDVETVLTSLLSAADYDLERAKRGIIFIDEIDKISRKGAGASLTRDVSGEGVQQALLKMIEGSKCLVPADGSTRKHPHQQTIEFDTTNVLFVFGGSFDGLVDIIRKRVSNTSVMGFGGKVYSKTDSININDYFPLVNTEDLIKFGIIPELLGRIPIRVTLDELNEEELKNVLIEPKNSVIKQYQYSFELDGATLKFEDTCYNLIVKRAIERKVGARGLRSIVNEIIGDAMFDLPDNVEKGKTEIYFNKEMVEEIFKKTDNKKI
jgi:ATP-dependent Clp protease ATP-binding subunit ClpX